MEDNFNKTLNRLIQDSHEPREEYSKERTWMLLQAKMKGAAHQQTSHWWHKAAAAAAIVMFGVFSWAMYAVYLNPQPATPQEVIEAPILETEKGKALIFVQVPLQSITEQLEQTFGVSIRIEGEALKDYRVTASFTEDESLEDIIALLGRVAEAEVIYKDNEIILRN